MMTSIGAKPITVTMPNTLPALIQLSILPGCRVRVRMCVSLCSLGLDLSVLFDVVVFIGGQDRNRAVRKLGTG